MSIPDWVQDAIFYQIFPDRFANGDPRNDPPNVQPWGSPPTVRGFQGGDLAGITQKLGYLTELGVNALYLNPIFLSASTHRYDTVDYYQIDPKLGNLADFHKLIDESHRRGMHVILDGVFNHCARGFFAFNDLLENGPDSPYVDWFHIYKFPLNAYTGGKALNYTAWWGIKSLPKFNTETSAVRRYLLDVARYWIEQGADGWRLDVPNEIDDDAFWAEFRQVVRAANPQAYLLGEIWDLNPRWANDAHFDGLMNYPVRNAVLQYLNREITTTQFADQLASVQAAYAPENMRAMYLLLGSHDTERIMTILHGDERKVGLAFLIMFGFPGVPSIYYGDELGMEGQKDPDCRRAFPWQALAPTSDLQEHPLRSWIKTLIGARKESTALRRGDFLPLWIENEPSQYAFARVTAEEQVIIVCNASPIICTVRVPLHRLSIPDGAQLHSLTHPRTFRVEQGYLSIELEPYSGDYVINP